MFVGFSEEQKDSVSVECIDYLVPYIKQEERKKDD
jgi:hypothetical protein